MRRFKAFFVNAWKVIRDSVKGWYQHKDIFLLSASLSYYAIFSLPGLLVIVIAISGYFFGAEAVNGRIFIEMKSFIGEEGAAQVQDMIKNAYSSKNSVFATVIGIGTLVYSASGIMYQLQQAINRIWGVEAKPRKAIFMMLRDRLFSFGMIAVFCFLLMLSLVLSAVVNSFTGWVTANWFSISNFMLSFITIIINLLLNTFIFILIYKVLPDVKIRWKDVWVGALVTAILFEIGKFLIGFYIGHSNPGSTYGAAGSIILILIWVSYSSLIVFYGAVFTEVYTRYFGKMVEPSDYAIRVNGDPLHLAKRRKVAKES